jgi:hypothetical protein
VVLLGAVPAPVLETLMYTTPELLPLVKLDPTVPDSASNVTEAAWLETTDTIRAKIIAP